MLNEFKKFALRGNVVDLAVGIIIGAAFGTIVSSMVADILMPPIGLLLGKVDFTNIYLTLSEGTTPGPYATLAAAKAAGAVTLNFGVFFNHVFSFLITAFAVFLVVRGMIKLQKKEDAKVAPAAPAPNPNATSEALLTEIRDLLKAKS